MALRSDLKQVAVQLEAPIYQLFRALETADVSDSHRFRTYVDRALSYVPPDAPSLPPVVLTARAQLTKLGLVADAAPFRSNYVVRRLVQSAVHDNVHTRVLELAADNDATTSAIWRPLIHFGLLLTFDKLGPDAEAVFRAAHQLPFPQQSSAVDPPPRPRQRLLI